MKVNVILITYKQEDYIRQTVESILKQETTFDFNIIVADDASPDKTLDIIKEYARNSDRKFIFLDNDENLGFVKNYKRTFEACSAEYIAIMEGDDWWTEPSHLQQHIDFLDNHPECSMSFNRHLRFFQDENREEVFEWNNPSDYELITTQDIIFVNRIGNLSCCVFRTNLIKELDPKIYDTLFADWLLGMIMGNYGYLAYLKGVTSAYRIHNNGQWTKMTDTEQHKFILDSADTYNKLLDFKYDKEFQELKRRKKIILFGDNSLRGKIKKIIPHNIITSFRKYFR